MKEKLLSKLSRVAGIVTVVILIISVVSQLTGEPVVSLTVNNPVYSFGRPGIELLARKQKFDSADTVSVNFIYEVRDSTNTVTKEEKGVINSADHYSGLKQLRDSVIPKMFAQHHAENEPVPENEVTEKFRVMAANILQTYSFAAYDLARYACIASIFFGLAKLFKNFKTGDSFKHINSILLRRTGWLLLMPQLLKIIVFWIFLANIHPVDPGAADMVSSYPLAFYDVYADIEWILVFICPVMLLLSTVFKEESAFKEETKLTI